jgi:hypothetical protein
LLHEYPIDLVLQYYRAVLKNQKEELKVQVLGFSVAVMNALDLALGKGEGKILKNWLMALDGKPAVETAKKTGRQSTLSPDAIAFLSGMPVKGK